MRLQQSQRCTLYVRLRMNDRGDEVSSVCHVSVLLSVLLTVSAFASNSAYDEAPINYSKGEPKDPVARLQKRLSEGKASLPYDEKLGYLPALLKELSIPAK